MKIGRFFRAFSLLLAVYFVTARIGLTFDAVSGFASLIWPASGISFAALYLFGIRLWPAIALGAFLVNTSIGATVWMGVGMSLGNGLEALVSVLLFQRLVGNSSCFNEVKDVLALILVGVIGALISATFGVTSMYFAHIVSGEQIIASWKAWLIGNILSFLVFAPLIIIWFKDMYSFIPRRRRIEAAILSSLVVIVSLHLFGPHPEHFVHPTNHAAWFFLLFIWTTLRFGQQLNVLFIIAVSGIAIWGTVSGYGPFVEPELSSRLTSLQLFIAAVSITSLLFGALGREKERALALRSDFVSIASHELRTPISAVDLQLKVIKNILASGPRSEEEASLQSSVESCERQISALIRLCDRLLDASQIESGRLTIKKSEMDLSETVERTIKNFQKLTIGIQISHVLEPKVIGNWDQPRLEEVLMNLLTNAAKYGSKEGVLVELKKEPGQVLLKVTDYGPGIAPNLQSKIFEKFERLENNPTSGLGLGLYISKQIIEAHDGRVLVESKSGQGTTFTIGLPV